MRKSKSARIIERIAAENGESIAEVRRSMQEAINIAYENHDESSETFWKRWKGRTPTPDEFLVRANKEVLDRLNFGNLK